MAASPAAAPSERSVFKTLFVYGPLMAEEACVALLGRMPSHRPATLSGFLRCCKRGAEEVAGVCTTHRSLALAGYPAAVQTNSAEHQVEGLLLERLRPKELRALDFCAPPPTAPHRAGSTAHTYTSPAPARPCVLCSTAWSRSFP